LCAGAATSLTRGSLAQKAASKDAFRQSKDPNGARMLDADLGAIEELACGAKLAAQCDGREAVRGDEKG